MKKKITLLLVFMAVFAAAKVPYRLYSPKLLDYFVEQAANLNIHLQAKEFKISFPFKAKAKEISAYLPVEGFPIPIYCEEANYNLSIASLFLFTVKNLADVNCYQSKLDISSAQRFFSDSTDIELNGDQLQIYNHPLLKGLGVMGLVDVKGSGTLNQSLPELVEKGAGEVKISDGTYIGGHKIKGIFAIPGVKDLNAEAAFVYQDKTLVVDKLKLDSSLASGSGSGRIEILDPKRIKKAILRFNLDLSDRGLEEFGPYLALATRNDSDKNIKSWKIKLEAKLRENGFGYKSSYKLTPR